MTVSDQHQAAIAQRARLRGWPTEADIARAAAARDGQIAETHAALDEDDRENGRAPRPDNHATAVRLTDRANTPKE